AHIDRAGPGRPGAKGAAAVDQVGAHRGTIGDVVLRTRHSRGSPGAQEVDADCESQYYTDLASKKLPSSRATRVSEMTLTERGTRPIVSCTDCTCGEMRKNCRKPEWRPVATHPSTPPRV